MKFVKNTEGKLLEIDDDNYLVVGAVVEIDLSDIIAYNLEGFLDAISEAAGLPLLMDIDYKVIGYHGDAIVFRVTGDTSMHIESEGDNDA